MHILILNAPISNLTCLSRGSHAQDRDGQRTTPCPLPGRCHTSDRLLWYNKSKVYIWRQWNIPPNLTIWISHCQGCNTWFCKNMCAQSLTPQYVLAQTTKTTLVSHTGTPSCKSDYSASDCPLHPASTEPRAPYNALPWHRWKHLKKTTLHCAATCISSGRYFEPVVKQW